MPANVAAPGSLDLTTKYGKRTQLTRIALFVLLSLGALYAFGLVFLLWVGLSSGFAPDVLWNARFSLMTSLALLSSVIPLALLDVIARRLERHLWNALTES